MLPTALFGSGEFYILRANGDSMIDAGIEDGDYVLVKQQVTAVNNGHVKLILLYMKIHSLNIDSTGDVVTDDACQKHT